MGAPVQAGRHPAQQLAQQARRQLQTDENGSVVYYARKGDLIKIGYTRDFIQRMRTLKVDEVLATEPGGQELEFKRLKQFYWDVAIEREWLHPSPTLMAHIAEVVDRYGIPPEWRGRPYRFKPKISRAEERARRDADMRRLEAENPQDAISQILLRLWKYGPIK